MKLVAFTHTAAGLFKVYDHGSDWQIIGPNFERWCSVWETNRAASFNRAVSLIPDATQITYTN